jgi:diaminopimelate decarboxylase
MNHFQYINGEMHCEDVPMRAISEAVGTPTYVYSAATLRRHFRVFDEALKDVPHLICYSVKACPNIAVLRLLANEGSGFDVVSAGEIHRLREAGADTTKVVFSGVGKRPDEMAVALHAGIHAFNVESPAELEMLNQVALTEGLTAPVSLRVNPDVDPKTHPYIATGLKSSKFGIPWQNAVEIYDHAGTLSGLKVVGLDCHIGSQLTTLDPFLAAVDRMLELVVELRGRGHNISSLDLGGGLGITYADETPPHPRELAKAVTAHTEGYNLKLLFEPGRVIVGNAGVLLMKVLYRKSTESKEFVIVDAAMNDSIRPALYGAYHEVRAVDQAAQNAAHETVDVVGPICESGDFFAKDRAVAHAEPGDLLTLMSAGGYGFSMASNYNSRTRAAEVLVIGDQFHVIRKRETLADLTRGEAIPSELLIGVQH